MCIKKIIIDGIQLYSCINYDKGKWDVPKLEKK